MKTFEEKLARYPFAAARLDAEGRVKQACPHGHGRREADAIACARRLGWDGFAELLVTDDAPSRPNDVWRFRTHGNKTRLENLGSMRAASPSRRGGQVKLVALQGLVGRNAL